MPRITAAQIWVRSATLLHEAAIFAREGANRVISPVVWGRQDNRVDGQGTAGLPADETGTTFTGLG